MPSKCQTALAAPGKCSVRKPPPLSRSNRPVKPHSSPGATSTAVGNSLFVHTCTKQRSLLLPCAVLAVNGQISGASRQTDDVIWDAIAGMLTIVTMTGGPSR
jgi:hypothetical protein